MKRLTVTFLVLAALLALVACGGDDDEATPTPTVPGGVNTSLPRHLTSVKPEQASNVTNADLNIGGDGKDGGICASFDFTTGDGMGDDPTSLVKIFFNREEVTQSAVWQVTASQPATGGTVCYAPPQALEPGEQVASVIYKESTDREFIYNWTFTISDAASSP